MKTSFKINIAFYTYAIILILSGYINYLVIYLFILITHEIGHIITIKLLKYKIESITLLPCGGIITTNINLNIKSLHLFLISISGILMQLILLICVKDPGSYNYDIFYNLNISLIIFNLLPIIPNDGYKILLSINENIFKYRISHILANIISIITLFILFYITKNIIIFVTLYIFNIKNILEYKYIINKFLLERYLYKTSYKRRKYIKSVKDLYKSRNNYIKYDKIVLEEEILLENLFMSSY